MTCRSERSPVFSPVAALSCYGLEPGSATLLLLLLLLVASSSSNPPFLSSPHYYYHPSQQPHPPPHPSATSAPKTLSRPSASAPAAPATPASAHTATSCYHPPITRTPLPNTCTCLLYKRPGAQLGMPATAFRAWLLSWAVVRCARSRLFCGAAILRRSCRRAFSWSGLFWRRWSRSFGSFAGCGLLLGRLLSGRAWWLRGGRAWFLVPWGRVG